MDVDSPASMKQLTRDDAQQFKPVWSPDGKWIAYVSWEADTGGHIWRMRANGRGKPQQLTRDPAFYTEIAFSPDGDRIVALRGSRYLRQQSYSEVYSMVVPVNLVWLPADGGDTSVIAPGNGLRHPHVTNDTSRVYAYDGEILVSMRWDGSDRREHLSVSHEVDSRDADRREDFREPGRSECARNIRAPGMGCTPAVEWRNVVEARSRRASNTCCENHRYRGRLYRLGRWRERRLPGAWVRRCSVVHCPAFLSAAPDEKEDDEEEGGPIEYVALDEDDSVDRLEFEVNMPRSKPYGNDRPVGCRRHSHVGLDDR